MGRSLEARHSEPAAKLPFSLAAMLFVWPRGQVLDEIFVLYTSDTYKHHCRVRTYKILDDVYSKLVTVIQAQT